MEPATEPRRKALAPLDMSLLALALAVPFVLLVLSSLHEGIEHDETLTYWVDCLPRARDILAVQLHYPLSLEPPLFHFLAHITLGWFPSRELGLRFPSVLAYLALQLALFSLVRRVAGARGGVLAAILPGFTVAFQHGYQGRPYEVLLALSALSLLAWMEGKSAQGTRRRAGWNLALGLFLLLTEQTHFFGMLLLLPVTLGEVRWSWRRRSLDRGSIAAILFGYASLLLLIPFARIGKPWRVHNFPAPPDWREIYRAYHFFLFGYEQGNGQWHLPLLATMLFLLLAGTALWRWRKPNPNVPPGFLDAAVLLAALPVVGHVLAVFITHHMEYRYVIAAIVGLAALAALALATPRQPAIALALVLVLLAAQIVLGIHMLRRDRLGLVGSHMWAQPSPPVAALVAARPQDPIYTADIEAFLIDQMYLDDPALRQRLVLVYDFDAEMAANHTDLGYLSTLSMTHFLPFRIEPAHNIPWNANPIVVSSGYYPDFLTAHLDTEFGGGNTVGLGFAGVVKTAHKDNPR